jgi:hypothetical protein
MKTKYTFDENKITRTFVSGDYIWIAFEGSTTCKLYKCSVYDVDIVYWTLTINANKINSIIEDATYLYLAVDHSTYIGAKIDKNNPTTVTYFTKEESILEQSIDIIQDGTYTYFLIPGLMSGTNAKIIKYNTSTRVFVEIIDLVSISNAIKIDIDNLGKLWVQSNLDTTPKITSVWYDGDWNINTVELV